ncbi:MAG: hypothetical protein ABIG03_04015 [Candidatus Eisenbacteria bacterium]
MISKRMLAAWVPRVAALTALLSIASSGGCDWFNDPLSANLAPSTTMVTCPADVTAGDDVTVEWGGFDIDGSVVEYRWSYDERSTGATSGTSLLLEDVAQGPHRFEVAAVDDDGDVDATPAFCEFTASDPGGLVERVVLIEFITAQPCANCPYAEEALNVVLDEYGADNLCIVSYHDLQPPSDPVATPETVARIDWYTDTTELVENAWPIAIFDGEHARAVVGAQSVNWCVSNYEIEIDHRKSIGSPLTVELSGSIAGGRGDVTVRVDVRDPLPTGEYVLRTVVIEDDLSFPPDHVYGYVARDLLADEPLTVSSVGDTAVVQRSFTVDPGWVVGNMDVIAFVQDDETKEVMQAGRLGTR